jgi:pimeloyl-ACP methyl ester carboxylesterase
VNAEGGLVAYFHETNDLFSGFSSASIADRVATLLESAIQRGTSRETELVADLVLTRPNICLTRSKIALLGHSRGGLIAINVAKRLLQRVSFLGLYDAVDRAWNMDADEITNVDFTDHARRHPEMESFTFFGNCGLFAKDGQYREQFIKTTHGGIGGTLETAPSYGWPVGDHSCSVHWERLRGSGDMESRPHGARARLCEHQSIAAHHWICRCAHDAGMSFH